MGFAVAAEPGFPRSRARGLAVVLSDDAGARGPALGAVFEAGISDDDVGRERRGKGNWVEFDVEYGMNLEAVRRTAGLSVRTIKEGDAGESDWNGIGAVPAAADVGELLAELVVNGQELRSETLVVAG